MNFLIDTSVWINHFRSEDETVASLLERDAVMTHPAVIGELTLGGLNADTLSLLQGLPRAQTASDDEVLTLIREWDLTGRGIGYVDAHLLTAAVLTPECALVTDDRRLAVAARGYALDRVQAFVTSQVPRHVSLVDELITERRAEAAKEAAEDAAYDAAYAITHAQRTPTEVQEDGDEIELGLP